MYFVQIKKVRHITEPSYVYYYAYMLFRQNIHRFFQSGNGVILTNHRNDVK